MAHKKLKNRGRTRPRKNHSLVPLLTILAFLFGSLGVALSRNTRLLEQAQAASSSSLGDVSQADLANPPAAPSNLASRPPPPGPDDTVRVYDASKGAWEDGRLRDVPIENEFIHAGRLMRLRGSSRIIEWVREVDVSKLAEADAAYDPTLEHRFPETHDVVHVIGENNYHTKLGMVPPGRQLAFQGRVYEIKGGTTPASLQIGYTGLTLNRVTNTFKRNTDTLIDLTIRYTASGNEETLSGTPEHPFFVPAVDSYVAMGQLKAGTILHTTDGSEATVVASKTRHGDFEVHNVEVEHAHNYFVSSSKSRENGVLVHNTCKPTGAGRGGTRLKPDPQAQGPHSTFKRDTQTGKVTGHAEWKPNPKNPSGFDEVKRVDVQGEAHFNKATKQDVATPHTHGKDIPGGVRPSTADEVPR